MKWHKYENQNRYDEMTEKGLTNRYEARNGESFDMQYKDVSYIAKLFSEAKLPPPVEVLVIGTGTGADACILADMGYHVTAIDIIDKAILQAKLNAKSINKDVVFLQDDIINPKHEYGMYDIIFSSSCLQSIVTDDDRCAYYNFVLNHMKKSGKHIITSAGFSPSKDYSEDIRNNETGLVFSLAPENIQLDDIVVIKGKKYAPSRRHYTLKQLSNELFRYGFKTVYDNNKEYIAHGHIMVVTSLV